MRLLRCDVYDPAPALLDEHEKGAEFQSKRADGESVAYKIFV